MVNIITEIVYYFIFIPAHTYFDPDYILSEKWN